MIWIDNHISNFFDLPALSGPKTKNDRFLFIELGGLNVFDIATDIFNNPSFSNLHKVQLSSCG
jgi:hypothetical protein